ncbi:MAG: hypothetical protein AB1609_14335 [Bacillota bacterium]
MATPVEAPLCSHILRNATQPRGYLPLYLVEAVAAERAVANLGVAALTGAGLVGAVVLLPLLGRIPWAVHLRPSATRVLVAWGMQRVLRYLDLAHWHATDDGGNALTALVHGSSRIASPQVV